MADTTDSTDFQPAAHVASLLCEAALSSHGAASRHCRFQAVLSVRPGEATLQVLETTDFNQLPHITLAFRPGSDAAVKAFLAGRLADVKAERAALSQQLIAAAVRLPTSSSSCLWRKALPFQMTWCLAYQSDRASC